MARTAQRIGMLLRLRTLLSNPAGVLRALRDPKTPLLAKLLPVAAFLYLLFPIDILPDFIPLFGGIDDLSIAVGLIFYALRLVPSEVLKAHGVVINQ